MAPPVPLSRWDWAVVAVLVAMALAAAWLAWAGGFA